MPAPPLPAPPLMSRPFADALEVPLFSPGPPEAPPTSRLTRPVLAQTVAKLEMKLKTAEATPSRRQRDCHFAGTASSSIETPTKERRGCSRMTVSPTANAWPSCMPFALLQPSLLPSYSPTCGEGVQHDDSARPFFSFSASSSPPNESGKVGHWSSTATLPFLVACKVARFGHVFPSLGCAVSHMWNLFHQVLLFRSR